MWAVCTRQETALGSPSCQLPGASCLPCVSFQHQCGAFLLSFDGNPAQHVQRCSAGPLGAGDELHFEDRRASSHQGRGQRCRWAPCRRKTALQEGSSEKNEGQAEGHRSGPRARHVQGGGGRGAGVLKVGRCALPALRCVLMVCKYAGGHNIARRTHASKCPCRIVYNLALTWIQHAARQGIHGLCRHISAAEGARALLPH